MMARAISTMIIGPFKIFENDFIPLRLSLPSFLKLDIKAPFGKQGIGAETYR